MYSTFFSRAFDQANLDVGLLNLPVVFVFKSSGITGDDGPSHHGLLDIVLCLAIPNMTIFAPSTAEEIPVMLDTALSLSTPTRFASPRRTPNPSTAASARGSARGGSRGGDGSLCVLAVGKMAPNAYKALERMGATRRASRSTTFASLPPDLCDDRRRAAPRAHHHRRGRHSTRRRGHLDGLRRAQSRPRTRAQPFPTTRILGTARVPRAPQSPTELLAELGLDADGLAGAFTRLLGGTSRSFHPAPRGAAPQLLLTTFPYTASMSFDVEKSDDEWRGELDPDRYAVLRKAATEAPFSGSLLHVDADGVFHVAVGVTSTSSPAPKSSIRVVGGRVLTPVKPGTIIERVDRSLFRQRTEILCSKCGGHLGHVFNDGPTPNGLRYCVNSLALDFDERLLDVEEASDRDARSDRSDHDADDERRPRWSRAARRAQL
jgi:methionine-R-sulfoxide reductase